MEEIAVQRSWEWSSAKPADLETMVLLLEGPLSFPHIRFPKFRGRSDLSAFVEREWHAFSGRQ